MENDTNIYYQENKKFQNQIESKKDNQQLKIIDELEIKELENNKIEISFKITSSIHSEIKTEPKLSKNIHRGLNIKQLDTKSTLDSYHTSKYDGFYQKNQIGFIIKMELLKSLYTIILIMNII
jgi:hypothetical protein